MKVHKNIDKLPSLNRPVVTIGTFDGVHPGHRQIISQLKKEAARIDGETVLITFEPHPRKILGHKALQLINTPEEKIELLQKEGIDHLVFAPFTPEFAAQTAEQYVEDFLVARFHPHTVIIGYDHRFGKNRSGDFKLLEWYAAKHAFELIEIPGQVTDEITISSTKIREALLKPGLEEASRLLGYDYFFEGTVVEGNHLGKTLGYPTANLRIENEDKLVPANGVYAVRIGIGPKTKKQDGGNSPVASSEDLPARFGGMMNIGFRPTVGGSKREIEVNIFDFNKEIYGQIIRVYLKKYLRPEQKFSGLESLKQQLAIDKKEALLVV